MRIISRVLRRSPGHGQTLGTAAVVVGFFIVFIIVSSQASNVLWPSMISMVCLPPPRFKRWRHKTWTYCLRGWSARALDRGSEDCISIVIRVFIASEIGIRVLQRKLLHNARWAIDVCQIIECEPASIFAAWTIDFDTATFSRSTRFIAQNRVSITFGTMLTMSNFRVAADAIARTLIPGDIAA